MMMLSIALFVLALLLACGSAISVWLWFTGSSGATLVAAVIQALTAIVVFGAGVALWNGE